MLLYRIQNKQTKKFFSGIRWFDGRISWTVSGAFFRTPDTIQKHLEYLCGEFLQREKDKFPRHTRYTEKPRRGQYFFGAIPAPVKKFKIKKSHLAYYRVIIDDVALKGQKSISAKQFFKKDK